MGIRMFSNAGDAKMGTYVLGAYLGGFILYLVFGVFFYRVRFLMIIIFHFFMIQIDQNDIIYSDTKQAIWHLAIWQKLLFWLILSFKNLQNEKVNIFLSFSGER